jgi:hypothetical protein
MKLRQDKGGKMIKKRIPVEDVIKKVNESIGRRKVGVYDFPSHVEDNKTGKKCRVCGGELLKEFRIVSYDNIIGPGHKSHAELYGYYCSQCGIRYKNLPK